MRQRLKDLHSYTEERLGFIKSNSFFLKNATLLMFIVNVIVVVVVKDVVEPVGPGGVVGWWTQGVQLGTTTIITVKSRV